MNLDLTDEQTTTLLGALDRIIDGDRFPLSPRIRMLKEIVARTSVSAVMSMDLDARTLQQALQIEQAPAEQRDSHSDHDQE